MFFQQVAHPLCPAKTLDVRHLFKLLIHLFEPPQVRQDRVRRLLADARHPGNVVGGVALQRLDVRHVLRPETFVTLPYGFHVVDAGVAETGVHEEPDVRRDQLELVRVARDDECFDAFTLGPGAQSAYEVIRLEPVQLQDRDAERLHDRLDHGDLLVELRVHLVPERGRAGVQREGNVGGGVVTDDLQKRV